MTARRHGGFQRTGSRRLTQWVGPADQGFISVASGGATLIASVPLDEAATIVRTRGMVSLRPTTVVADLDIVGAIGMGIVSTEAFNAGVGSIPEPFSDGDWGGWFVWRSFAYEFQNVSNVGLGWVDWNFEVDSKAMRKGGPSESVVIIAESQVGAYGISTPLRMLLKLS